MKDHNVIDTKKILLALSKKYFINFYICKLLISNDFIEIIKNWNRKCHSYSNKSTLFFHQKGKKIFET